MEGAICINNILYEIIERANEALGKKKQTHRKKHKKHHSTITKLNNHL